MSDGVRERRAHEHGLLQVRLSSRIHALGEASEQGPVALQMTAWLDREQEGREPPYGKALDIGCGTGRDSVELARRGWEVTGIDMIPKAVDSCL